MIRKAQGQEAEKVMPECVMNELKDVSAKRSVREETVESADCVAAHMVQIESSLSRRHEAITERCE